MDSIKYSKIKSIKRIGKKDTYDIEMPTPNNYVANKFVTHNSGQTMLYVNRHLGKEPVEYEHPLLKEITKDTLGIILYQEQVMHVMTKIGKMSWATAEMARKAITKSKGAKAFEHSRKEFVTNAVKFNGLEKKEAQKLFDVVSTFGSYSFNLVHAVEYSILSYWTAWLKTYYPQQFMKAILKYEGDDTQIGNYLQECKRLGIKVNYPHVNKSKTSYVIDGGEIYAGFDCVKGIGSRTAQKIIKHQPYESFEDFLEKCKPSKTIIKGLAIADAFRDWEVNKKLLFTRDIDNIKNFYDKIIPDYDDVEYAQLVMENTSLEPRIDIKKSFDFGDFNFIDIRNTGEEVGGKMGVIRGIVTKVVNKDRLLRARDREHECDFEQRMLYLNVNDGTGNIAAQINPWVYEMYKDVFSDLEGKPVVVFGNFAKNGNKMYASLLQFPGESNDVERYFKEKKKLEDTDVRLISQSVPSVSKKGNSYFRLILDDGTEGLCFRFDEKLLPGMKVKYKIDKEPFMEVEVVKDGIDETEICENN